MGKPPLNSLISKLNCKQEYFILLIIVLIGIWLRFSGIITNSFAFTYDVGRDLLAVKEMIVNLRPKLIGATTGLEGFFYGPWWYYFLVIPFMVSGGNPQAIVSAIALVGIGNVLLAYGLGKKIANAFLGLTLASLVSFSPTMVGLSNQIWNPNLAPTLVLAALFLLYKIFNQKKNYFFLLGATLALIIDVSIVYGVLFLLAILISLLFFLKKLFLSKNHLLQFILGFTLIILPRIIFEIRHQFLMTKNLIRFLTATSHQQGIASFNQRLLNRGQIFLNLWQNTVAGQNKILALTLSLLPVFLLIKNKQKISRLEKFFLKVTFVIFLTSFLGLTLFKEAVWAHYLVGLPVFFILFLGLVINLYQGYFKKAKIGTLLLLIILWLNLKPIQVLSNLKEPVWEGDVAVYRNQLAVLDYIYQEAKGKDFKYITYTPAVHDYHYRYLFSWYGPKQYGYQPRDEQAQFFFVILEPDHQFPERLQEWLKVRKGDGQIIKETVVKGGIKVQTRQRD